MKVSDVEEKSKCFKLLYVCKLCNDIIENICSTKSLFGLFAFPGPSLTSVLLNFAFARK